MRLLKIGITVSAVLLVARVAEAQSCLPFLSTAPSAVGAAGQLVTLNKNGIASATRIDASYQPAGTTPQGGARPARWIATGGKQLFSDRLVGAPGPSQQPFNASKSDVVDLTITIAASPQVTVVLKNWGGTRATFRGVCSSGGVIHGSTPDVDYLLTLGPIIVK